MRRSFRLTALLITLVLILSYNSKGRAEEDPLFSLIDLVIENEEYQEIKEDSIEKEIDPNILLIIGEIYADSIKQSVSPMQVLSFITEAYSEHGFEETGSWVKPTPYSLFYRPYKGELPPYSKLDFKMPVVGRLTSRFGYRPHRKNFHKGIDMALSIGDTVRNALPGVVTRIAYEKGGYGNYIIVSHADGLETLYGHLHLSLVRPGQHLNAGDPLGIGGSSGNSTGPHLHFEARHKGVALDPVIWFNLSPEF